MSDLSVNICGINFSNPLIAASGTFGYGNEYTPLFDTDCFGGICSKGLTLDPKPGNNGTRLFECASGLINSIGLENLGIRHFIQNELPQMSKLKPVSIANLSGSSLETYTKGAELLENSCVQMIELNISCPNVKAGGMAFGLDCKTAAEVTSAVRAKTSKPLIVKLSPNASDITKIALSVAEAGADAVSMINTIQALAINIETGKPVFENIFAGFSGPAVKPIALRMVYQTAKAFMQLSENERIPIIGLGGISNWQDAVEFIMAGAKALQIGTATFSNPLCAVEILDGLKNFMQRKGYKNIEAFCGMAL